jgi:hypothetical protein
VSAYVCADAPAIGRCAGCTTAPAPAVPLLLPALQLRIALGGPGRAGLRQFDLVDEGPQRYESILFPLPLSLAADLQACACPLLLETNDNMIWQ